MNIRTFRPYFLLSGHLALGLILLLLPELIRPRFHAAWLLLPLFMLLNGLYVWSFRLQAELKQFWMLRRAWYFLLACAGGVIIGMLPLFVRYIGGEITPAELQVKTLSVQAVLITLMVVAWEELWFRSVLLNYCHRKAGAVPLSLFTGLVFMFLHVFNPEISLLKAGPALFFAGTLLTLLYFYYRSIWVPVGLHFGNNLAEELFRLNAKEDVFFMPDGYFTALLLALVVVCYAKKISASAAG